MSSPTGAAIVASGDYRTKDNLSVQRASLTTAQRVAAPKLDAMIRIATGKDTAPGNFNQPLRDTQYADILVDTFVELVLAWAGASQVRCVTPTAPRVSYASGEAQVVVNKGAGTAREVLVGQELRLQYPEAAIQRETYLRLAEGEKALDPLTQTGRRIDWVVLQDGAVLDSVETTSMTANKAAQIAKEMRIRQAGGVFVRDRATGQLIDISQVPTRIVRKP